jgi:hypothetical protein
MTHIKESQISKIPLSQTISQLESNNLILRDFNVVIQDKMQRLESDYNEMRK